MSDPFGSGDEFYSSVHQSSSGATKGAVSAESGESGIPHIAQLKGYRLHKYHDCPIDHDTIPHHFVFWTMVGKSSFSIKPYCGKWKYKGCLADHSHVLMPHPEGPYVECYQKVCHNSSCPVCYPAWARREAGRAWQRIKKYMQVTGKDYFVHAQLSVPLNDYNVPFEKMKNRAIVLMKKAGVKGAVMAFHPFRFNKSALERVVPSGIVKPWSWYFAPHFHIVYSDDGFTKTPMRAVSRAKRSVLDSDGKILFFIDKDGKEYDSRRYFDVGGWVFKNIVDRNGNKRRISNDESLSLEQRIMVSVKGTLNYQLSHCGLNMDKRHPAVIWVGDWGTRKIRFTLEERLENGMTLKSSEKIELMGRMGCDAYEELKNKHKEKCPICNNVLQPLEWVGEPEKEPLELLWKDYKVTKIPPNLEGKTVFLNQRYEDWRERTRGGYD